MLRRLGLAAARAPTRPHRRLVPRIATRAYIAKSPLPDLDEKDWQGRSVTDFTFEHMAKHGEDHVVIIDGDTKKQRTVADLRRDVGAVAHMMISEIGVGKGDICALLSPNDVDYFAAVHAPAYAGAAVSRGGVMRGRAVWWGGVCRRRGKRCGKSRRLRGTERRGTERNGEEPASAAAARGACDLFVITHFSLFSTGLAVQPDLHPL